ncbi:unnamed protein product [Heligmosomoides polygyrus]|uniref:ING domain-containing protein n=1 Tax=Heligmosomoides polygyrus TaxID=6339 RepID=A0A183G7J8_HELPZ|nr:unnamed protein product [Heligmosomoides polygyrus]
MGDEEEYAKQANLKNAHTSFDSLLEYGREMAALTSEIKDRTVKVEEQLDDYLNDFLNVGGGNCAADESSRCRMPVPGMQPQFPATFGRMFHFSEGFVNTFMFFRGSGAYVTPSLTSSEATDRTMSDAAVVRLAYG